MRVSVCAGGGRGERVSDTPHKCRGDDTRPARFSNPNVENVRRLPARKHICFPSKGKYNSNIIHAQKKSKNTAAFPSRSGFLRHGRPLLIRREAIKRRKKGLRMIHRVPIETALARNQLRFMDRRFPGFMPQSARLFRH